jgi:hypothetical protein
MFAVPFCAAGSGGRGGHDAKISCAGSDRGGRAGGGDGGVRPECTRESHGERPAGAALGCPVGYTDLRLAPSAGDDRITLDNTTGQPHCPNDGNTQGTN